ncbi:MAG: J domain-containing protein [Candidatus Latescibacterota bacterium]
MPTHPRTYLQEDPCAVLGVAPDASPQEIRAAYFARVREHAPERDPEAFKRIRAAYDVLRNPQKREEHEVLRPAPWAEPEPSAPPPVDLTVRREDLIAAARALCDLGRTEWHQDCAQVSL